MADIKHDDFGEKIGGAKKDLWQKRGLLSDDLSEMNERETDKYVKKDNIWKKPDYKALIDSGIPTDVVFYIKTVRDSIETAPVYRYSDDTTEKKLARKMQYIDTVREVQNAVLGVKCKADIFDAFNRFMVNNGYYENIRPGISGSYFSTTEKGRENPVITNKLSRAMFIKSEWDYLQKIANKSDKQQFGVSKVAKVPKGFEVRFNDGQHTWSANNDWKPDTYFVAKGHNILQKNFETKDEALKWVRDFAVQQTNGGKKRFIPTQLQDVRRDGPDYRCGRDVDGNDYLKTFGFKGGEFGNWMTQNDRQASLNFGYDALKDLAAALKIDDKDISYQGVLSIAFGARGSGNAAAHYEPLRKVINLTKMNGAGSLAHEWFHGIDDFLGMKMGADGLLSEMPSKHPLFKKLIDTIKYKPDTPEQAAAKSEKQDARTKHNAESWLKTAVLPYINRSGDENDKTEYEALKDAFLRGEIGTVDKLNELKKKVTDRIIPKKERNTLLQFESILHGISKISEPIIGTSKTEYYLNSIEMGKIHEKDGNYWESNTELTARAFATYIMDTLPERSDYLAGHAESAVGLTAGKDGNFEIIRAYPQGEERKAINAVFDEIIAELKLQNYLTHDEQPPPEPQEKQQNDLEKQKDILPETRSNADFEQPTLLHDTPQEKTAAKKPSMIGWLAAAKEAVAKVGDIEKQFPEKSKKRDAESL